MATMNDTAPDRGPRKRERRRLLGFALLVFVVLAAGYAAYWMRFVRGWERTDDAYVQGNVVQVTPQVAGVVVSVAADDTDFVKAGQPLVVLDASDADVGLRQALAQLAQTVREVRTLYAANATWAANIAQREAEVVRAKAELARAEDDLARRSRLADSGGVSGEEMNHARTGVSNAGAAVSAAEAALRAARQSLATNQALTEGTSVERHPNVERAAARVREAYLARARTVLPAPVSGYVAKRTVQVGQRVAAGTPLLAIVPLDQLWVDANFKEGQLQRMRIGQPATLTSDVYGSAVEYHGTVAGLGAGTGSAFALLPPQNATGNWIKIVQRVPVRIAIDREQLAQHPLRVGLSMEVGVRVTDASGPSLASAPTETVRYTTSAFDRETEAADALVRKTIEENAGERKPPASRGARVSAAPARS